jgi:cytochrome c-type biogenesis protein CcmH/NrfG
MTFNPWPSSDWVAFAAERGLPAAILIALVFIHLAIGGIKQLVASSETEHALAGAALLATVIGTVVVGLFDAVLLLPVPAFLAWATLGALYSPAEMRVRPMRWFVVVAVIIVAAIGAARTAAQLAAMEIDSTRDDRSSLERAASLDPGNYRLHLRLARTGRREQRCEHARIAHGLFPNARAAAAASRGCGE